MKAIHIPVLVALHHAQCMSIKCTCLLCPLCHCVLYSHYHTVQKLSLSCLHSTLEYNAIVLAPPSVV